MTEHCEHCEAAKVRIRALLTAYLREVVVADVSGLLKWAAKLVGPDGADHIPAAWVKAVEEKGDE